MSTTMRTTAAAGLVAVSVFLATLLMPVTPAAAAPTDISCVPVQVAVFVKASRIHVRCAAAVGGISYFAIATNDAPLAARVLSILTTSQVAGRTIGIRYDPADLSGGPIGCQTNDCRLIIEVWFGQ